MSNPRRREIDDWWQSLPAETRDSLDHSARRSIIDGLARYPYWDLPLCAELLAWANLEGDILTAHADWLSRVRARATTAGRDWDTAEVRRQSRLDGDLTTPPEWIVES